MGLWQHLAESYDRNADAFKVNYPLSTTSITNKTDAICVITINEHGCLIGCGEFEKAKWNKNKKEWDVKPVSISIPVSEKSLGRSSGIEPHPVFDQYEYVCGKGKKFERYIDQLKKFAESTFAAEEVKAIFKYLIKRSVVSDLCNTKVKDKTNVIFKVEIPGKPSKIWENQAFFGAWHKYYLSIKMEEILLDYITGNEQTFAILHPKKISNTAANAKLVSGNDKTNFTFRGKFSNDLEAFSIGYETSQKAHQFLRFLVDSRGNNCGEQVILSFTVGSEKDTLPKAFDDTKTLSENLDDDCYKTEKERLIELLAETGDDYAEALRMSLKSLKASPSLNQHDKTAVVALDAATDGRLSITFYRELERGEYLEKIAEWHDSCKWNQFSWHIESERYVPFIGAPSVDKIIEAIYGKSRTDEGYIKIKKAARERLLRCIFDGATLPFDYLKATVSRASNPLGVTSNGKFDRNGFRQILSTTCALVRKYYPKEEYKLSIEHDRKDRDYLYGRLLGAADKLEAYALYKKDNDRVVTAAIRYMQAFAQRPFSTWNTIHSCLSPYIQSVKGGFAFQEIMAIKGGFILGEYENDRPLNGSYLLGYYHELAYIDQLAKEASSKKLSSTNAEMEHDDE